MSRKYLSWWHLSISGISQLLLTWFWWNFKCSFLRASRTDSNYQVDICTCNICPGDICPYQEYPSCYWPDVDKTLKVGFWNHLYQMPTLMVIFVQSTFALVTFVHIRNISAVTDSIWPNYKGGFQKNFDFNFLEPDHFTQNVCTQNLLDSKFFGSQIFFPKVFLDLNFF